MLLSVDTFFRDFGTATVTAIVTNYPNVDINSKAIVYIRLRSRPDAAAW